MRDMIPLQLASLHLLSGKHGTANFINRVSIFSGWQNLTMVGVCNRMP